MNSRYLQPTVKHPPSVMVWGCFSSQGRGGLYFLPKGQTMNASRYISVLDDHLLHFMSIHGCTTFQQDSAPCHKANSVMNWFQTKKVRVVKWPGNSPDLNPIENRNVAEHIQKPLAYRPMLPLQHLIDLHHCEI